MKKFEIVLVLIKIQENLSSFLSTLNDSDIFYF